MKISIIIQVYNLEKYVAKAINSVLNQKINFSYEIIIYDDCSTDNSSSIIKKIADQYPRLIRHIKSKKNLGNSLAFYDALSKCNGEYFTILDGDDYWLDENKIQEQVEFLENNKNYVGIAHNTKLIYENSEETTILLSDQTKQDHSIIDIVTGTSYFHTSAILYRNIKDNIPKYFQDNYGSGDLVRLFFYAQYGLISYVDKVQSAYLIHSKGEWSRKTNIEKFKTNLNRIRYYNKLLKYKYDEILSWRIGFGSQEYIDLMMQEKLSGYKNILKICSVIKYKFLAFYYKNHAFSLQFKKMFISTLIYKYITSHLSKIKNKLVSIIYRRAMLIKNVLVKKKRSLS